MLDEAKLDDIVLGIEQRGCAMASFTGVTASMACATCGSGPVA
jgi:hypothetical protein